MTREDILAELDKLEVDLGDGSVYGPKTLRIVSFDFYEDGVRYGLVISWMESDRVTPETIAKGIQELMPRACKLDARMLWIPSAGKYCLFEEAMGETRWVVAPWLSNVGTRSD